MTVDPARFVDHLDGLGVELFTGVPDSLLKDLCAHLMATLPRDRHVIAANEGAAVAIAMGHHLRTGRVGVVYLQNSGIGNTINPLLSLADPDVYGIPMVLVVGWRGQPGGADEPQHIKQGRVMEPLLDALGLPWAVLDQDQAMAERQVTAALQTATDRSTPYVLLVERGTFGPAPAAPEVDGGSALPSREDALVAVVQAVGDEAIQVATTGMLGRELFEHRQRSGATDPGRDFLTVGGMGHACSIALGVAMSEPRREVWCLDGDGAVLMHLGSLAVIADHRPANMFHVVFNNGVHDSVGGQPTSVAVVDLPKTAVGLGYRTGSSVSRLDEVGDAVADLRSAGGPSLLDLRVRPGNRPGIGRPDRTPAQARQAFMASIR